MVLNIIMKFSNNCDIFDLFWVKFTSFAFTVYNNSSILLHKNEMAKYFPRGRREQTTIQNIRKSFTILELYSDYNWSHRDKCIQISTNMPDIGLEICEISRILRSNFVWIVKQIMAALKVF